MSMDFTEFRLKLGAEPRSRDPAFLAACESTPEHREAVAEAMDLENKLERAFGVSAPADLLEGLKGIPGRSGRSIRRWPMALAASLLVAVGAAGVGWQMNRGWDSVEAYVVDHYRYDGDTFAAQALESSHGDVHAILAEFGVDAAPQLADIIGVIKYCPTPGGKGVHMILNTDSGPVTVFYMPHTDVTDREMLAFDGKEAMLVDLDKGSAVIIGSGARQVQDYYAVVHDSIVSVNGPS